MKPKCVKVDRLRERVPRFRWKHWPIKGHCRIVAEAWHWKEVSQRFVDRRGAALLKRLGDLSSYRVVKCPSHCRGGFADLVGRLAPQRTDVIPGW